MYNNNDIIFFDYLRQGKAHHPGKSEGDILYDDGVVDVGPRVHQLLPQPLVAPVIGWKEAKIHP